MRKFEKQWFNQNRILIYFIFRFILFENVEDIMSTTQKLLDFIRPNKCGCRQTRLFDRTYNTTSGIFNLNYIWRRYIHAISLRYNFTKYMIFSNWNLLNVQCSRLVFTGCAIDCKFDKYTNREFYSRFFSFYDVDGKIHHWFVVFLCTASQFKHDHFRTHQICTWHLFIWITNTE